MRRLPLVLTVASAAAALAGAAFLGTMAPAFAQGANMSFFVTSANPGKGADFGGLAGADQYCTTLASAAGAGGKTWRAYLSTTGAGGVNARDRIGRGPWVNAKGQTIAANVDELHGTNKLTKQTALDEKGEMVMGRGDATNMHDILTGSTPEGRAATGTEDTTCGNWTKSGDGSAIVGHHDRMGLRDDAPSKSWNSSHPSRGCSLEALKATGGDGRLYCFAAN
ncbi:MAG TPA: hypothetical protein VFM98_12615 [Ramlibacter sp.]|uniref:hypothetical protein n=1 Tax=Ramlibacter sp. TaxID=1917967 RepID=UPI002D7E7FEF|nr:hypothetical protein [Ramlibacter sp.]HET8746442.1 hypothetical protein [Ramlibacter sp.]